MTRNDLVILPALVVKKEILGKKETHVKGSKKIGVTRYSKRTQRLKETYFLNAAVSKENEKQML